MRSRYNTVSHGRHPFSLRLSPGEVQIRAVVIARESPGSRDSLSRKRHEEGNRADSELPTASRPTLRRAVFLDRDGVLNDVLIRNGKPHAPTQIEDFRIPPGTAEALARLKQHDFLLLVVTNQPDVARGVQKRDTVEEISRRLRAELPLDDVLTCFHDDQDDCDCRKPRPGLVTRAAQQYGIDLGHSYLIGDRWRDMDAGTNAGCQTIWIDRGYVEQAPAAAPNARVGSLPEAVDWILRTAVTRPYALTASALL